MLEILDAPNLKIMLDGEENLRGSGGGRCELERDGERQKYGIPLYVVLIAVH